MVTLQMIHFISSALFGVMISFMILVTPIVFKVLDSKNAQSFLRTFFPRLFNLGLIVSGVLIILSFQETIIFYKITSISIFFGFMINQFIITPKINKYRDLELNNTKGAKKVFSILHFISVFIFIIQLILTLLIIFT
tara:strand:- start:1523 stop:1933 length:411 start_codon:yes stop_codon:yes gene_type:complete